MTALVLGLLAVAWASPTGAELTSWSTTGVEALPDAYGKSGVRAVERLGADIEFGDGWSLALDGGLRILRAPSAPVEGDLYRLAASHRGEFHRLTLGRHVRLDVRGFERIDGASLELESPGALSGSVWAGRLWHAEEWDPTDAVVFGGQFHVTTWGRSRTRVDGGYEGRVIDGAWRQRIHVASASTGPKGARTLAFLEVGPNPDGFESRASVSAGLPVGRTVDVGLDGRWEDMAPDHAGVVRTPIDWLAPEGYALLAARIRWFQGPWDLVVEGGGTLRAATEGDVGGIARASGRIAAGHARAGVFGMTAALGGSWLAGGGGEVSWSPEFLTARADVGVYRMHGIDGAGAEVWEGRIQGRVPIYQTDREGVKSALAIGFEGAAGTDRQLATWVRGGIALHATVERERTR